MIKPLVCRRIDTLLLSTEQDYGTSFGSTFGSTFRVTSHAMHIKAAAHVARRSVDVL